MTCQHAFRCGDIGRLGVGQQQRGHLIRPFSLHAAHERRTPILCEKILWLPLQSAQRINLYPPHVPHVPVLAGGTPCSSFFSSPISFSCNTSLAPPMYRPPMNTLGRATTFSFDPSLPRSSDMKPVSMETSRSSISTRNPCKMESTVRQASKVDRTTRRLV